MTMPKANIIGPGQKRAALLLAEKAAWQRGFYSPESAIGVVSRQLARSSARHNEKAPSSVKLGRRF